MTNAAVVMGGDVPVVTHASLGWKFIHWGLGLFITGFITGFIPIAHYMHGALAGDVGPIFLKNMTLWWGCPAILAELTLKTGGLGMAVIGLCYLSASRQGSPSEISKHERIAPTLCSYGLIAELVTAGVGYALFNYFWPNFFFEPVQAGKNTWLALQGISIAVYVFGLCYAVAGVRRASRQFR
ncbi:hypothetical protein QTI17_20130 [Variovorax sp. J31P179]|uniref:hypothetical protein n=1 Tax=Variovorax sp. J31P179 TaxID=3053508 RepID=UPI0025780554|nr:hypothetical protein [Variovorax sp. J31P179]MDM0082906.1 hypothetical protein [Variovorax sp. J31P179]